MRMPTSREMAGLDREAQEAYEVPGLLLMEHAALVLRDAAADMLGGLAGRRIELLCGTGNNGGDGFALARLVTLAGAAAQVRISGDPEALKGDARANFRMLEPLGIPVDMGRPEGSLDADLVVDALLGTGAEGEPRGGAAQWVAAVGDSPGVPVLAVDIPSGVPGDGGEAPGIHVRADRTVTMGLPKPFVACPRGRDAAGELVVARIGFPEPLLTNDRFPRRLAVAGAVSGALPPRPPGGHKGDFGKVLVCGGSPGLSGAPFLAARGALRAGAGLVKVLTPDAGAQPADLPEAMVTELPEDPGEASRVVEELAGWADAVVLGCGLGPSPRARDALHRLLTNFPGPVVVDADGLPLLEAGTTHGGPRVLTPHPGEIARMLGEAVGPALPEREAAARKVARDHRAVVVLKGRFSLVSDGELVSANPTGSPSLGTGGTGDVLAGALGGLLAARTGEASVLERVRCGVWLHGLAGDLVEEAGALAREVADALPRARERLEAFAGARDASGAYPTCAPEDGVRLA